MGSKESYRNELRKAIRQLGDRAGELLVGIDQDQPRSSANAGKATPSSSARPHHQQEHLHRDGSSFRRSRSRPGGDSEDEIDDGADYYLLAKSYFDCKEYRRAAHVLRTQTSKKSIFSVTTSLCYVVMEELCAWYPVTITKAVLAPIRYFSSFR
ncbi:unnamed protein product [Spirodela intermedia]|uniref:Cdc23 domain-containing protein n=1 Tax=Spirodela intermedia TaxID=51605 RepID=A0ABN7EA21_SPIIN|nr:unnamed protein product [Spirodela intermedia]